MARWQRPTDAIRKRSINPLENRLRQIDCRIGDVPSNLRRSAPACATPPRLGARLAVFPECVLTGYCFESRDEAWPFAEPVPGPSLDAIAADCRELGVWAVVGMLERGDAAAACSTPAPSSAPAASSRLTAKSTCRIWSGSFHHAGRPALRRPRPRRPSRRDARLLRRQLPGVGPRADRPRRRPARAADQLADRRRADDPPPDRRPRLENHVYYAACNRVGEERGFRFIGQSRILDCNGELLASAAPTRRRSSRRRSTRPSPGTSGWSRFQESMAGSSRPPPAGDVSTAGGAARPGRYGVTTLSTNQ